MGERGPARTPTKILEMRGSWRAKARAGEPKPERMRPRCPRWLSAAAKRAWRRLMPQLEQMGILGRCDREALARYCMMWAKWREVEIWLMEHGDCYPERDGSGEVVGLKEYPQVARAIRLSEHLLRLEKQFGLTPAARAGMAQEKQNPFENRGKRDLPRIV